MQEHSVHEDTQLIAGIWVCATRDALIQRNEVARTRMFENDGTAFDTDWELRGLQYFSITIRMTMKVDFGWTFAAITIETSEQRPFCLQYQYEEDGRALPYMIREF